MEKCSRRGFLGTGLPLTMISIVEVLSLTWSVESLGLETSTTNVWCPVVVKVAGTLCVKLWELKPVILQDTL